MYSFEIKWKTKTKRSHCRNITK